MATLQQLQLWLTEAETALHKLEIGAALVSVGVNGVHQVNYTPASVHQLRRYVAQLKDQVAAATGSGALRRRAIGIIPQG